MGSCLNPFSCVGHPWWEAPQVGKAGRGKERVVRERAVRSKEGLDDPGSDQSLLDSRRGENGKTVAIPLTINNKICWMSCRLLRWNSFCSSHQICSCLLSPNGFAIYPVSESRKSLSPLLCLFVISSTWSPNLVHRVPKFSLICTCLYYSYF